MRNWQFSEVAVTLRADALPPEGTPPRTIVIQYDKKTNMHCPCLCKMFWFLTGQNILKIRTLS